LGGVVLHYTAGFGASLEHLIDGKLKVDDVTTPVEQIVGSHRVLS
jgi:hypothetical protein